MTNVHYIEKYIRQGDKILDIGAGTGEYSLYFSSKGYQVSALEFSEKNIEVFQRKQIICYLLYDNEAYKNTSGILV